MEIKVFSTQEEFREAVGSGVALVDFFAPWCAPCRAQEPILSRIATQFENRVLVGGINIAEHQSVAAKMGITGIPTLAVFKDGKEIQRFVGLQPESALSRALGNILR